jgi:4-hydroxy-tetrahydrodipicolinate reductase
VSTATVGIGLHGALGRMGIRLIQLIAEDPRVRLVAAIDREDHPKLGQDAGELAGIGRLNVPIESLSALENRQGVDVVIDFSHPSAALELATVCARNGIALVVGTTGFEAEQRKALEATSTTIPILLSPNMSRAVNLLMKLVGEAAAALAGVADIEIVERHHHLKKDSPSGTALKLAEIAAKASGADTLVHGREGLVGERKRGEIGVHAVRSGDCPGEHTVSFGLLGETLELSHRALNRDGFVRGAIDAARFLAGKPAGLYSIANVLDFAQ